LTFRTVARVFINHFSASTTRLIQINFYLAFLGLDCFIRLFVETEKFITVEQVVYYTQVLRLFTFNTDFFVSAASKRKIRKKCFYNTLIETSGVAKPCSEIKYIDCFKGSNLHHLFFAYRSPINPYINLYSELINKKL
jgi:hypothetical protein